MEDKRFMMFERLCTRSNKHKGKPLKPKHAVNDFHHNLVAACPPRLLHQALGMRVMFLGSILVAGHLAIQFIDQLIDSGIQVFMGALGE